MTKTIYHRMKALNVRMTAHYRRGIGPARVVLLLTTTGRIVIFFTLPTVSAVWISL